MAQWLTRWLQVLSAGERGQNLAEFAMVSVFIVVVLFAGLGVIDSDYMTLWHELRNSLLGLVH